MQEQLIDTSEVLEATRKLREYMVERYGEGAIAIIEPHNITIYAGKVFIGENPAAYPHKGSD